MSYYSDHNFCPEMSVGYLVRRIHQLGQTLLEPIFDSYGISYAQWSVLVQIYLNRSRTCATLARDIGYDKGAMTRLIDDLVAKGFVVRERCNEDRRVIHLTLTAEGERLGIACKDEVIAAWNGWLRGWDAAEIDRLVESLNQLKTGLETLVEMEPAE